MLTKEAIEQVVFESGLWRAGGGKATHGFILSPSVYEVSQEKREELEAIGAALYDCLAGLGRIAAIARNPQLGHGHTWGMIARVLRTGVPKIYHDIMVLNASSVPSICKVDIMESGEGNFRLAEIDGHNKHGLGYSTLTARIRRAIMPEAQTFPGVATILAKEMERRGESGRLVLLYADQERFYLPEFRILQNELATLGINLVVIAENDASVESIAEWKLLVDFPFLYYNQELNSHLAGLYRNGEIDFLIPPKPFFGSKAVLALLRNDIANEELEAILKSQIRPASLELLRRYIPETYLVHKGAKEEYWRNRCNGKRFLLKESISSGMKGIVFPNESHFNAIMKRACGSYYRFILQEEVTNRSRSFHYFTDEGYLQQGEWFVRVTVHYAARRVADIILTARRDKKVHGAIDCLMLGAVMS